MTPPSQPAFALNLTARVFTWALRFLVCGMPIFALAQPTLKPAEPHQSNAQLTRRPGPNGQFVHGTINVVLANGNGIVALTDSMATEVDSNGHSRQSPRPSQKLFVLDDSTVCTIAGFASQDFRPYSGVTTDIESIIYSFAQQLQHKPTVPLVDKLHALESMISVHLELLAATTNIVLGHSSPPTGIYTFELIMGGYDPDGDARIGTFSLKASPGTSRNDVKLYRVELQSMTVEDIRTTLRYFIKGQSSVALPILDSMVPSHLSVPSYHTSRQSQNIKKRELRMVVRR